MAARVKWPSTEISSGVQPARLLKTDIVPNVAFLVTQAVSRTVPLIRNLSLDRIQFETCTSKESCTARSKQILVRSQHRCEGRLSLSLSWATSGCHFHSQWRPGAQRLPPVQREDLASSRLGRPPPLCLRTRPNPDPERQALAVAGRSIVCSHGPRWQSPGP